MSALTNAATDATAFSDIRRSVGTLHLSPLSLGPACVVPLNDKDKAGRWLQRAFNFRSSIIA
jgi:hypothetical protein